MGRPLRAVYANGTYSTGVREMSDSDINSVASEVIITSAITSNGYSTVLRVNPGAGDWVSVGTAYDIINAPIGNHPASNSVVSTYTMYQSELTQTPIITARPVHYVSSGGVHQIKEMTNQEIIDSLIPAVVQTMITGGRGAYYLSLTSSPPGTGTWVSRSVMTDTYYNASNVYTTDSYTLWQRTTGASLGTTRPLKRSIVSGETRLIEMTDVELGQLYALVGEYIRTTGIGRYAFQFSAPASGTWTNRGAFVDTVNVLTSTSYNNFFSGTYTGFYSTPYSGSYSGSYTGFYTGAVPGSYSGSYTGYYAATYSGILYSSYEIPYTGYYTRTYAGTPPGSPTYSPNPPTVTYSPSFPSFYTGYYAGAPFTATYYNAPVAAPTVNKPVTYYYFIPVPTTFTGPPVAHTYNGAVVYGEQTYYEPFTGYYNSTRAGTIPTPAQNTVYEPFTGPPVAQPPSYGPPYAASYAGTTIVPNPPTVGYSPNPPTVTPGTPGSPGSSGPVAKTSYYGPIPTETPTTRYGPSYSGSYTGSYTGAPLSYSGSYTGAYTGAYSGPIPRNYTGAYTGSFSGLTVQTSVTTTTYNLWVRTA